MLTLWHSVTGTGIQPRTFSNALSTPCPRVVVSALLGLIPAAVASLAAMQSTGFGDRAFVGCEREDLKIPGMVGFVNQSFSAPTRWQRSPRRQDTSLSDRQCLTTMAHPAINSSNTRHTLLYLG